MTKGSNAEQQCHCTERRKHDSKQEQDSIIFMKRMLKWEENAVIRLLHPFNTIFIRVEDRYTCLCFQHNNIMYKAAALCNN